MTLKSRLCSKDRQLVKVQTNPSGLRLPAVQEVRSPHPQASATHGSPHCCPSSQPEATEGSLHAGKRVFGGPRRRPSPIHKWSAATCHPLYLEGKRLIYTEMKPLPRGPPALAGPVFPHVM